MNGIVDALGIHHIGWAVTDLAAASVQFETTYAAEKTIEKDLPDQGVRAASYTVGSDVIELIAPLGDSGPLVRFLEKNGEGLHHMALGVADISATLGRLDAAGYSLIDAQPRIGLHGEPVAFVHPRSTGGILLELVESVSNQGR